MRALPVVLCAACVLIAAPAASAADGQGVRIDWPKELTQVKLGDRVSVGIASERHRARVSLVRLGASGKPLGTVASRSLKRGTFRAEVSRLGNYQLRVVVNRKRYTRSFDVQFADCPGVPGAVLSIALGTASVRAGGMLPYTLTNMGSSCALAGDGYSLERQAGDGPWVALPRQIFTLAGHGLTPGVPFRKQATIPADASPGRYRLTDSALVKRDTSGSAETSRISATAEFDVTG